MALSDGRRVSPSIDTPLVRRLVAAQFPCWAHLPITRLEPGGWDNRSFRLGGELTVRLPSDEQYVPQVDKEYRWLPYLAPHLPLPVPVPVAKGAPGEGYPWPWSIYRWLEGESVSTGRLDDLTAFAETLAEFLIALQHVDATGGPPPGPHSFYRGGPLQTYDADTRRAIEELEGRVPRAAATAVWETAMAATWKGTPVWFHGDVSPGNLLVRDGRLAAVIDFGCSGVGDPACDLIIAWTLLYGESRKVFRAALPLNAATWARGRGWALWKALITVSRHQHAEPVEAAVARRVIDDVLAEHRQSR